MTINNELANLKETMGKVKYCLNLQIEAIKKDLDPFTKEIIISNFQEILGLFDEV